MKAKAGEKDLVYMPVVQDIRETYDDIDENIAAEANIGGEEVDMDKFKPTN